MSLTVPPSLLRAAESGPVDDEAFAACVRESLPYAWQTVSRVASELASSDAEFADNQVPPPSEAERGQLLRALASDAIRSSLERHFGVKLAFQNCHRIAAFRLSAVDSDTYRRFTSTRGQLLNQSPELRDC
ncbi:SCO5389 family protein [Verrucosispora sp. WMMC514]|uniref:SCO5389 family protein n=1 Tax=Verrucosispora sp. WMMC514 TaxID=3015156 RepID=UPI00248BA5C1|nr:SCO5389 family protein [Verrucosispora sp. WMMC514]WBB90343.1 SCO5389 family protein [Verrucosispora sp. WMMC514]